MTEMRNAYSIVIRKPERNRPRGRPRIDGRIILKWIIKKEDVRIWSGFYWLRIGTRGRLL